MRTAAAFLGLSLLAACGRSAPGDMQMDAPIVAAPPVDREVPDGLETATFALG